MPIDTDILSFGEYNANCSDENTKVTQLVPLVLNTGLTSSDTNKIVVRKSSIWTVSGLEAYNGHIQDFGSISNSVALVMNNTTSRIAMKALVTGNTFITDFTGILTGFVYVLFLKQDSAGGKTVRFPYGASVLKSVGLGADQITVVFIVKMATGKLFIKCEAFENTMDLGAVIKEFEDPSITYPSGETVTASFTWSKAPAVSYGGVLTGLYSDWEIAIDSLYSNLLFSSYGNSTDITSIQVILTQSGSVYMRTRYGGNIAGTPVVSSWDEAICEITSGEVIVGDQYWNQTVFCLNANTYNGESPKIVDSRGYFTIEKHGAVRPVIGNGHMGLRFSGANDLLSFPDSVIFRPTTEDFTFEMFFSADNPSSGTTQFLFIKSTSTGYTPFTLYVLNGKLEVAFYRTGLTSFILRSLVELTANKIYHVAAVRSGSSFKLFLDGVLQQEQTEVVTLFSNATHPFCFGTTSDYLYRFTGYIYSVRITKNIARYSDDFNVVLSDPFFTTETLWWTPEPKQIATDNFIESDGWDRTECLINGYGSVDSISIVDEIGNTITRGGNTKIDVTSDLSSIIFDGNGDYLYVGKKGNFNFLHNGSYNWTVEFWFNPSSVYYDNLFDTCLGSNSNHGVTCYFDSETGKLYFIISRGTGNSSTCYISGIFDYAFSTGTIYHVAITLDWSLSVDNAKLYVNGTLQASLTKSSYAPTQVDSFAALMIGGFSTSYPQYMFTGKIYSFRISSYLRYTANFSVDNTRPYFIAKPKVINWFETSFLINAKDLPVNSTDIRDAKGNQISVYGSAKIGIENGLQYINFTNSTLDCLQIPSSSVVLGNSDFTIQCFIYKTTNNPNFSRIYGTDDTTHNDVGLGISGTGKLCVYLSSNGSTWDLVTYEDGPTLSNNVLYHVALVRFGSNLDIYVNGIKTSISTGLSNTALTSSGSVKNIGGQPSGTNRSLVGRIYGFSIIKKALYTSNFNVDLTNPYFPSLDPISDLWVEGSDFSKMALATGITNIVDKSGNKFNVAQGTATNQPALLNNGKNGLVCLDFDGTNDFLTLGSVLGKPSNFSVIVMAVFDTITTKRNLCGSMDSTGQSKNSWGDVGAGRAENDGKFEYSVGDGTGYAYGRTTNGVFNSGSWVIFGSVYSGGNKPRQFLDGLELSVSHETGSAITCGGTAYNFSIGRGGDYNGQYFDGKVLDLFIFKFAISPYLYNKIVGYLAHKADHLSALPPSHPHKITYPSKDDTRSDDYWYATVLCLDLRESIKSTDFFDSSKKNKITVSGNATIALQDYQPYVNFDGTGGYLSLPSNPSLYSFGTGDFTIEAFFSVSSLSAERGILAAYSTWSSVLAFYFVVNTTGAVRFYAGNNIPINLVTSTVLAINTLYHVAVSRFNGVTTIYINGVSSASTSNSANIVNTSGLRIGTSFGGEHFNGKIYSMRITKGRARYTENFEVGWSIYFPKYQTQNINIYDKYWDNVIFNISSEFSSITDYKGRTISNSGVTISTALGADKPSMYFNGSSYFTEPATNCGFLVYKNSDWTLEFFIWATTTTNYRGIMQYGLNTGGYDPHATFVFNSGTRDVYTGFGGSSGPYGTSFASCPNELSHVAFCFNNTSRILKTFVNGVLSDSTNIGPINNTLPGNGNIYFGRYTAGAFPFTGHITSMRLTKDVERYTSNFDPLTKPYFPRMAL